MPDDDIVVSNPGRRPVELHHGSVTHVVAPGSTASLPRITGAPGAHLGELLRCGLLREEPEARVEAPAAGGRRRAIAPKRLAPTTKAAGREATAARKTTAPRPTTSARKAAAPRTPRKRTGGN